MQRVLEYSVAGNIQSVLDEYVHVLWDSLGFTSGHSSAAALVAAEEIGAKVRGSLTLRTIPMWVDVVTEGKQGAQSPIALNKMEMRGRFALRFGDRSPDDEKAGNRQEQVRTAFNSPFWPFVLATTSVGQEGLDFHTYCHAVVHWNLPSNPVDLEQREGRVHRYKGHAVRKNAALIMQRTPSAILARGKDDPWESLFDLARHQREQDSDLTPYWILCPEGGARINRYVSALPLSRDAYRAEALRRSLALYRIVFGQSRQEDLVAYLSAQTSPEEAQALAKDLSVDLAPPKGSGRASS